MPKKLYSWRNRITTLKYGEQIYHGQVLAVHKHFDPRNIYYFQTEGGELISITSNGKNRVSCINGGLVKRIR